MSADSKLLEQALRFYEGCPDGQYDELVVKIIRERLGQQPAQQKPVALKWQQAPIRTAWGDEMVVASVAINKDHTVDLYCERDQTPKVDAMFTSPPVAQRTWVGLTEEEKQEWIDAMPYDIERRHCMILVNVMEAQLKQRNT